MKKNYILVLLTLLFAWSGQAQITLSQNTSETIAPGSIACQGGGIIADNIFMRAFDLVALGYTQFDVTEVMFGIEAVANESVGFAVDVVIYSTDTFPTGALTEIAAVSVPLVTADSGTLKVVPIIASVTDTFLVFGVRTPDEANNGGTTGFQIGSNGLGQSAPSYIFSNACSITTPTNLAAVGTGFPDIHMVMTVTSDPLSVDEFSMSSISISPNPTTDFINIDMPNVSGDFKTEIYSITGKLVLETTNSTQLDVTKLNSGIYILKVSTENGEVSRRIVKK